MGPSRCGPHRVFARVYAAIAKETGSGPGAPPDHRYRTRDRLPVPGRRIVSADQEIADREVQLVVNIPGFLGIDPEHQRALADAVMLLDQILAGEDIQAGVLLV